MPATAWSPLQVGSFDGSLEDALQHFDTLMQDVMDIHMRTDVPLGLFLSGGVDSSLLAALLAQRMSEPLRTFSVGFPGSSVHNELDAARRVAEPDHKMVFRPERVKRRRCFEKNHRKN